MVARRLRLASLALLCCLTGVFALSGVSASAAVTHEYLPEASKALTEGVPAGSGATVTGPVSNLGPMTVDSGHLWVAEGVTDQSGKVVFRVDEFDDATGAFLLQLPQVPPASGLEEVGLGLAVAHGNVYVGAIERVTGQAEGRLAVFAEAGPLLAKWTGAATPAGSFGQAGVSGVAVDRSLGGPASGSVYVDDRRQRVVDVFKPESVGKEPPVSEPSSKNVEQLIGTCPVEGTTCAAGEAVPFNDPKHIAVDASNGHVLVVDDIEEEVEGSFVQRDVIDVFEPEVLGGYVFVRQIKLPVRENPNSIEVDGGSGDIYVAAFRGKVDQFSSTGLFLGRITGENTPRGDLLSPQSVAVDPLAHHVFVGDYREGGEGSQPSAVDAFGPDLVIPDVATGSTSGVTRDSAVLNGTVKLDKEGEATCRFVWGTSDGFGQKAPCSAPVTEEESAVQVTLSKATGAELEPDTTYYYRLQATNKNGLNPGEPAQDQHFTTAGAGIHGEAVSNVAASSVTFTARVNPHNAPTTVYFQYGTSSAYGINVPAVPGMSLGSGEGDVEVSPQHVQGLLAGTVYHYRVVAISEPSPGVFEEFDGPDQTFTTQQSGGSFELPDGRLWEMVTPPEKEGALFSHLGTAKLIQASVAGNAIVDMASQPTEAEPQGNGFRGVSVLSTRGSAGWSSQVITPPHNEAPRVLPIGNGGEYLFFSEDLSLGVVYPFGSFFALSPEASESTPYLRSDYLNGDVSSHCQTSCFEPLVTAANTPPGTVFGEEPNGQCEHTRCGPGFHDATPDLRHVVVSVKGLGFVMWSNGKFVPTGGIVPGFDVVTRHAISDDGSRIVGSSESGTGLFLHDMVTNETVRLDVPQVGQYTGSQRPQYMTASSDDSRVFFLDSEPLTGEASATGSDLYEYDLNAPVGSRLTDLSIDKNANEVASVQQVLGASEDGTYVYFVAAGALAPGAAHGTCGGGAAETCNLYVRHAGRTKLIAVLSAEDSHDWERSLLALPTRVSPDGRWLAFMSNRNLTGYDTHDAVSGHPDEEVYLYDAGSDRLVCASCNPTGGRPVGVHVGIEGGLVVGGILADAPGVSDGWVASNVPAWTSHDISQAFYQSRYLSDSGRLFFDSNDALVPQDVNGTEDVYEFEPVGVPAGSRNECTRASVTFSERAGGCVALISSGTSAEESAFLDASGTGGDVFFLTAAKLALQDFDTALDVYDARECSAGTPCYAPSPVSPPACSTGDSCKAAPSPQPPVFGSPSSATFSGAGNVVPSASSGVKSRSLVQAKRLAQALRVCRRKHDRARRSVCERKARRQYRAGKANATKKSGR